MSDLLIVAKQVLDELSYRIETLKNKVSSLYTTSGIAPQKWLDNNQAGFLLSVSKRTLQSLRDSGVLPFTKMGAKVFYRPDDIDRVLLMGYKSTKKQ